MISHQYGDARALCNDNIYRVGLEFHPGFLLFVCKIESRPSVSRDSRREKAVGALICIEPLLDLRFGRGPTRGAVCRGGGGLYFLSLLWVTLRSL